MRLKIRQLKDIPEYYPQVISLVESSFNYGPAHHADQDFAPLLSKNANSHNLLFFNSSNQLVGHIGILEKQLIYQGLEFPILLIGGVCVSIEYRGQGMLKEMMHEALSLFDEKYILALLWSSMTPMYEKFGFFEAGQVIQTGNRPLYDPPQGFKKIDISKCSQGTWEWITNSYNKRAPHEAFIKREEKDWKIIKEMKSVSLYVNEQTQEYFMMNKGMDLPGIIHEYSPQRSAPSSLTSYPLWTHPQKFSQDPYQTLFLSFMKIGRHEKFSNFLETYSKDRIKCLRIDEKKVVLKLNGQIHELHPQKLIRSLFGPGDTLLDNQDHICFTIGGVDSV